LSSRETGKQVEACRKGFHSRQGNSGNCVKAWESRETDDDKVTSGAFGTPVNNREGAIGLERGQDFCEGKALKGNS
jgi:hypothetical protein